MKAALPHLKRQPMPIPPIYEPPVAASPVSGTGFLGYAEVLASASAPQGTVYVATQRAVADGMWTVLRIENYKPHTHARFALALHFAATCADSGT